MLAEFDKKGNRSTTIQIRVEIFFESSGNSSCVIVAQSGGFCYALQLINLHINIGFYFGGRDHSTVIHAVKSIDRKKEKDSRLRNQVNSIKQDFKFLI